MDDIYIDVGNTSDDNKDKSEKFVYSETQMYSGPIARPEDFEQYERILPGAADRILKMGEKEIAHRHELTKSDLKLFYVSKILSLIFMFTICLIVLGGRMFLIYSGKDAGGLTALIGGLAGLAGVFLNYRKNSSEGDIENVSGKTSPPEN